MQRQRPSPNPESTLGCLIIDLTQSKQLFSQRAPQELDCQNDCPLYISSLKLLLDNRSAISARINIVAEGLCVYRHNEL